MKLRWSRLADADLHRIWLFLADRDPALADRIEARIHERAVALCDFPSSGRMNRKLEVRELSVPDIQYVISYRVTDDAIEIVRIQSTREDRRAE